MSARVSLATALVVMTLFAGSGATCARRPSLTVFPPPPEVFMQTPTTAELAAVINRTDQITKLHSNNASIQVLNMPSMPRLSANVAVERPRKIRIQASIPLLPGSGLDLGSNESVYWMRIPEPTGPILYFAPHEPDLGRYRSDLLSVEPLWLIDALGLARIDLSIPHTEPVARGNGLLEVRSAAVVGGAIGQRVLLIDARTGCVKTQYLLGTDGQLRAQADADQFEYFPDGQYCLPHRVKLSLTAGNQPMELQLDISRWTINHLLTDDPNLFMMPEVATDRRVNVSAPASGPSLPAQASAAPVANGYVRSASLGPQLRGIEQR